ncbi:hypothetical protein GCM10023091_38070 [Ravibacter arvi]|uniref:DUF5723 domain-containing protein n=1 Tax=Ravibacter arvi TaxID=2051041 RepID=A0ABP8M9N7_9BACT
MRGTSFLFLVLFSVSSAYSQDLTGLSASNYGGLYRATYNPSVLGGSRYKWQLNLGTINSTISSRYFQFFGRSSLLYPSIASKSTAQLYGKSRTMGSITDQEEIQLNSTLHLPSFMISLGKIHGVAVQVRSRGFVQGAGIPDDVRMLYTKRLDTPKPGGGSGNWGPFFLKQHSFTEVAFAYGVQLLDTPAQKFRVGATVKYIMGGRTSFIDGSIGDYTYAPVSANGENQLTMHQVAYRAGYTQPVTKPGLGDLLDRQKYGQGWALDAGLSYEIGTHWHRDDPGDSRPGYVLRVGASVNDVGRIGYKTASSTQFSGRAETLEMTQREMETIADQGPLGIRSLLGGEDIGTFRGTGRLPSMYHLEADFQVFKAFFIYAARSAPLNTATDNPLLSVTLPATFTIGPRWENEDSDYAFPVSFIDGKKKVSVGVTGRIGPVQMGFSNFLALIGKSDSKATYGYLGISLFHLKTRDYRKKIKWKQNWN